MISYLYISRRIFLCITHVPLQWGFPLAYEPPATFIRLKLPTSEFSTSGKAFEFAESFARTRQGDREHTRNIHVCVCVEAETVPSIKINGRESVNDNVGESINERVEGQTIPQRISNYRRLSFFCQLSE